MKVLSIEQMNKLKQLGVDTSKASVRVGKMEFKHGDPWYGKEEYDVFLFDNEDNDTQCFVESYRAFTLQDVIELLPYTFNNNYLIIYRSISIYYFIYENMNLEDDILEKGRNPLEAAYNMLIWVIENNYLKTK